MEEGGQPDALHEGRRVCEPAARSTRLFHTFVAGKTGQAGAAGSGLASAALGSAPTASKARTAIERRTTIQIFGVAAVVPQWPNGRPVDPALPHFEPRPHGRACG